MENAIQLALKKAIERNDINTAEASANKEKTMHITSSNETKASVIYDVIVAHQGCTTNEIVQHLKEKGYEWSGTRPQITNMFQQGILHRVKHIGSADYRYWPTANSHIEAMNKRSSKAVVFKPKAVREITEPAAKSAKEIVERMSVIEARAVYAELKAIFG